MRAPLYHPFRLIRLRIYGGVTALLGEELTRDLEKNTEKDQKIN